MKKLSEVQAFRGLAALLVVFLRATLIGREYFQVDFAQGSFAFGYAGVDFFFVLSGFIISYAHPKDIGVSGAMLPYLCKRAIRIYPCYWLLTLAILPVYFLKPDFGRG